MKGFFCGAKTKELIKIIDIKNFRQYEWLMGKYQFKSIILF